MPAFAEKAKFTINYNAELMEELVVVSGKGGTGKTSLTACFALLADNPVIADCDVDAADLHLLLSPQVLERHDFYSGREARINQELCNRCGLCLDYCRFDAISANWQMSGETVFSIDPVSCEGCGLCVYICPLEAIEFSSRLCGEWRVSKTRGGTMVDARLGIAAENSGKLVSLVRREARLIAEKQNCSLIIVDGPPGIGCPVIASVTGASQVLVITEPTLSGKHDLERVLALTRHFKIPAAVCVNKWDLNPEMTEEIEATARRLEAFIVGRIRYDTIVNSAQVQGKAVIELDTGSADDIRRIWDNLSRQMFSLNDQKKLHGNMHSVVTVDNFRQIN